MLTKLTRASQVTIPAHIRRQAGLKPEDPVEVDWDEKQAQIILKKLELPTLRELFEEGKRLMKGKKIKPMTAEEIDDDFDREIMDEYELPRR